MGAQSGWRTLSALLWRVPRRGSVSLMRGGTLLAGGVVVVARKLLTFLNAIAREKTAWQA